MDLRIPFLLLMGALTAFLTQHARKSGRMMLHYSTITRAEYPGIFKFALVMRWVLASFAFLAALAVALGAAP